MNISDVKCLKSRIKLLLGDTYKKLESRHWLHIVYRRDDYLLYMSRRKYRDWQSVYCRRDMLKVYY